MALLRNNVFCHSRESGNPESIDSINVLDLRFRRDDTFGVFRNSAIIVLSDNKFECLQIFLYCWIKNLKTLVFTSGSYSLMKGMLARIFFLRQYLNKSVEKSDCCVGVHKGIWYEINDASIELTEKFYDCQSKKINRLINYYDGILRTNKFAAFIKKIISFHIFALLKELHLVKLAGFNNEHIVMVKNPISEFIVQYMESKYSVKYKIKWITSAGSLFSLGVYYGWLFWEVMRRGVVFNKNKDEYKLSKEAVWGFYRATLSDDMIIDGDRFQTKDMIMLGFCPGNRYCEKVYQEVKKRGFNAVMVSKAKINFNKNILNLLFFYVIVPFKVYLTLFFKQQAYLFYYIFVFHRQSFSIEILMNLYRIKCHISTKDHDDVAATIIFNKYGTKCALFHWSDITVYKAYNFAFLAHNIFFAWGDKHYDSNSDNYFVDKKINIGCIYKKAYNKAVKNKENIIARIGSFKQKHKTVLFCDNSFNNSIEYVEHFFLEYLEIIDEFCKRNKDVNVLLKAKNEEVSVVANLHDKRTQYNEIWRKLINYDNFTYFHPLKWSVEEILVVSDICINMGMNTPSTIALICGKNALYYETTGNNSHPFSMKYRNEIVFEDKELLLRQMDNILKGKFKCQDVISEHDLREYDAFADDNALERLRKNLYELTLS